jgi:hypothetical protein
MKHKLLFASCLILSAFVPKAQAQNFQINDLEYFEKEVLIYWFTVIKYAGMFCDEKLAANELIQRGGESVPAVASA